VNPVFLSPAPPFTLRRFLLSIGWIQSLTQVQIKCPFHDDNNPSASLFVNDIRCWSKCGQSYGIIDFQAKFGVPAFNIVHSNELPPDASEDDGKKIVMFIGPES